MFSSSDLSLERVLNTGKPVARVFYDRQLPPVPRGTHPPEASQMAASANSPVNVNKADFAREVLQSDRPVLVDFWAPCHMVAPTIDAPAREQGNSLKVVKVNVDDNPGLAGRYYAMSIPTMNVFIGSEEVDRWVGALPENAIRSRLARWM